LKCPVDDAALAWRKETAALGSIGKTEKVWSGQGEFVCCGTVEISAREITQSQQFPPSSSSASSDLDRRPLLLTAQTRSEAAGFARQAFDCVDWIGEAQ
jgi:hypothetical protein